MHPSILAKRKAQALESIVLTAGALAKQFELDPTLTNALQPKGIKDPVTAEMMRMEALSDLLMAVGLQTGAVKESASEPIEDTAVTTVTEPHPVDEPADDPRPTLDDFPAHVVGPADEEEEVPGSKKPARKKPARSKKS